MSIYESSVRLIQGEEEGKMFHQSSFKNALKAILGMGMLEPHIHRERHPLDVKQYPCGKQ